MDGATGGGAASKLGRTLTLAALDTEGRRRSMVWRFYIQGDDVYFGPGLHFGAPVQSNYHVSLHADGRCHRTFDRKFFNRVASRIGLTKPKTYEWTRPAVTSARPTICAFTIAVLPDATGNSTPQRARETYDLAVPAPGRGQVVELQVHYSSVEPARFRVPATQAVLGHQALRSGLNVYFVTSAADYDPIALIGRSLTSTAQWLDPDVDPVLPGDHRGVLWTEGTESREIQVAFDVQTQISADNPRHIDFLLPSASLRRVAEVTAE
jgi:hypothetical protein